MHRVYVTHAHVAALGEGNVGGAVNNDRAAGIAAGAERPAHAVAVSQSNEEMRVGARHSKTRDNVAAAAERRHGHVQFG